MSVVVTVTDAEEPFLAECLQSVARQGHRRLEVVVACHGAHAVAQATAEQLSAADSRVQVLPKPSATAAAARNLALGEVTGELVTFVRSGDVLPRWAVGSMVRSLARSGSDFAVGLVQGEQSGPAAQGDWRQRCGDHLALADVPDAAADDSVEGKLFSRSFLVDRGLRFDEAMPTEVSPMVEAYLDAKGFDRVPAVTYRSFARGSGRPVGMYVNPYDQLEAWRRRQQDMLRLLGRATPQVREAWAVGVLAGRIVPFLDEAERASPEQWTVVVELVRSLLRRTSDEALRAVPVLARVKAWLTAADRREQLQEVVQSAWYTSGMPPTSVDSGAVHVELPALARTPDEPGWLRALSPAETVLTARLARLRWRTEDLIELEMHAFISNVSMTGPPAASAHLVDLATGMRSELPVRGGTDPEVTRYAAQTNHSHDHGVVIATVDAGALAAAAVERGPSSWGVEVSLTVHGISRTGAVTDRLKDGSAAALVGRGLNGALVGCRAGAPGLVLTAAVPQLWLADPVVTGRTVRGRITCTSGSPPTDVVATCGDLSVTALAVPGPAGVGSGERAFSLDLPSPAPGPTSPWGLRAMVDGRSVQIAWPEQALGPWLGEGPQAQLAMRRTEDGHAEVLEVTGVAALESVLLEESSVSLTARWLGKPPGTWAVRLTGSRVQLEAQTVSRTGLGFTARVSLRHDEWGLGASPAPLGRYSVELLCDGEDDARPVVVAPDLEKELPERHRSSVYRVRVVRSSSGQAVLALHTPYADDELGTRAQKLLLEAFHRSDPVVDERVVYFQSYSGHSATDSQLAIHEELRRTRPDLCLHWGVANMSTLLPEGAIPVLIQSRDWYDVLGRARYLVVNVDLPRWFRRRPGQRLLQTFHGYPAKSMGVRMWKAKRYTPRRIELELQRTSGGWDLILTPVPEMDQHYRREYAYDGPILSHGYPRDDVLVSSRADAVRARTRGLLGIAEHQTAVVYAPTWRDDLATTYQSAAAVHHLDVDSAAEALGDDVVLLLRGHRFHTQMRTPERGRGRPARLLDVTGYPEVNDLILAADAAVLDYSSLRFDFALTGRPMVFLAPDLDAYASASRGFLFDFRETAPGPLVGSTDEVVRWLKDLPALTARFAEDYARFNARFNYLQDGTSARRAVEAFFS